MVKIRLSQKRSSPEIDVFGDYCHIYSGSSDSWSLQQEQSDEPSKISFGRHSENSKKYSKKIDCDILKLFVVLTRLVEKHGIKEVVSKLESLM